MADPILGTGQVQGVNTDDGTLTVSLRGTPVPGVWNALPAYSPQPGDLVLVASLSGLRAVIGCTTPDRMTAQPLPSDLARISDIPTLDMLSAAPSGTYGQAASVYIRNDRMRLVGVLASPPPPPVQPPPTFGTVTVDPVGAESWGTEFGWAADINGNDVIQGEAGFGAYTGLWFYGGSMAGKFTGKTVTAARMTIVRTGSGGTSFGPMQLFLGLHTYAGQPPGQPVFIYGPAAVGGADPSLGASVTFGLPAEFWKPLVNGSAFGIGIQSASGASYCRCSGNLPSGRLSFDYHT